MKTFIALIIRNLKIADFVVIALFICAGAYLAIAPMFSGGEIKQLVLMVGDKQEYLKWSDSVINLKQKYDRDMIVEIKDGKARVLESSCPDKICIKAGWVSNCGEAAVCLPNSVAIVIKCSQSDYDISKRYSK